MPKKKEKSSVMQRDDRRQCRVAFMLNDREMAALDRYFKKYKVQNKSRFMREAIMRVVVKRLEEDSPTLFD